MLQHAIPPVSRGSGTGMQTYIFSGSDLLVRVEGIRVSPANGVDLSHMGLEEKLRCQVGRFSSTKAFAVALQPPEGVPEGFELRPLRTILTTLEPRIAAEASTSLQILNWDLASRFCGTCGNATVAAETEHAKKCTSCATMCFPRISPATITAVIRDRSVLLAHNKRFANGMYSLVAGFVEPGECLEECVKREVREETGVVVTDVAYFASQPWPFPDALMLGFTAVWHSGEILPDGDEIDDAQWFKADAMPLIPSPGSISRRIIDWFMAKYS